MLSVTSGFPSSAAWAWTLLIAALVLALTGSAHAQALEPRSYTNTPVGINFLLLGYGHTEGEVGFDASTQITDTRVRVDAGLIAYARSLDIFGLSGKVLAVLPVAEASGHAMAKGQARDRDVFGVADPLLRFSVNFFGAPALSLEEFATYKQDLIIGASLQVTAPLGQYNPNKLLNLGTNRWSIKSELGLSKAWGPLTVELIPAITFFTTNNDFFGGHTLEQDPIYSVQGHLIYEVSPAFWVAFDSTYFVGGQTTVDGVEGQEPANVRLGVTTALSLNRYQSVKFYGSTGVYNRTQNNFWALGIAWQLRWGGGL
jgi:hypothetical protein